MNFSCSNSLKKRKSFQKNELDIFNVVVTLYSILKPSLNLFANIERDFAILFQKQDEKNKVERVVGVYHDIEKRLTGLNSIVRG